MKQDLASVLAFPPLQQKIIIFYSAHPINEIAKSNNVGLDFENSPTNRDRGKHGRPGTKLSSHLESLLISTLR